MGLGVFTSKVVSDNICFLVRSRVLVNDLCSKKVELGSLLSPLQNLDLCLWFLLWDRMMHF